MSERLLTKRIAEGSIESNLLLYPETIGPFRRLDFKVNDKNRTASLSYAFYSNGDEIGMVTAKDLWQGLRQVWAVWNPDPPPDSATFKAEPQILYVEKDVDFSSLTPGEQRCQN